MRERYLALFTVLVVWGTISTRTGLLMMFQPLEFQTIQCLAQAIHLALIPNRLIFKGAVDITALRYLKY